MNNQEFFDKTMTHLRIQGEQSTDGSMTFNNTSSCKYRTISEFSGKVLSCAIGCHIPDELYDSDMEGVRITSILGENVSYCSDQAALIKIFAGVSKDLMTDMQQLHDNYFDTLDSLENRARDIASYNGVKYE